jgi:hypothetical protein
MHLTDVEPPQPAELLAESTCVDDAVPMLVVVAGNAKVFSR